MKERSKKMKKRQTALSELVIVNISEDLGQAEGYKTLLKASDIPAMVKEQHDELTGNGFAVFVPEDYLDEAYVIIESQDAYDDYYELSIDDSEFDDEFDDDFMDDDF